MTMMRVRVGRGWGVPCQPRAAPLPSIRSTRNQTIWRHSHPSPGGCTPHSSTHPPRRHRRKRSTGRRRSRSCTRHKCARPSSAARTNRTPRTCHRTARTPGRWLCVDGRMMWTGERVRVRATWACVSACLAAPRAAAVGAMGARRAVCLHCVLSPPPLSPMPGCLRHMTRSGWCLAAMLTRRQRKGHAETSACTEPRAQNRALV